MKKVLTFLFIVLMAPICNAQEEIIFNKQNIDKKDIKVSRTLQGLEFNMDFIRIFPGRYMGYKFGSIETHLNYFHESRIASTWTLFKSIGIGNTFYNKRIYNITAPSGYGSDVITEQYNYELSLNLKIEPRWYFDQRQRYRENKSTRNNTGWFLSLPLMLSTNLIQQPVPGSPAGWFPEKFTVNIMAPPTIGYRNSFAENLFVEVSAGYIPVRSSFYNGAFYMRSAKKVGAFSADSFNSELKVAYTF
ncbi:MAG: hypothetical protein VB126_05635 [Paludibacter sp.]|nr:hypothetical protein [Paludibacter sp.]